MNNRKFQNLEKQNPEKHPAACLYKNCDFTLKSKSSRRRVWGWGGGVCGGVNALVDFGNTSVVSFQKVFSI